MDVRHFAVLSTHTPVSDTTVFSAASMLSTVFHSVRLCMFCMPMKRLVERSPEKQRWQESLPPLTKFLLGVMPTRRIASSA